VVADGVRQQPVAYLPRKHRRVFALILADGVDDARRRHLGLAAADHARLDRARLVVPATRSHQTTYYDTGSRQAARDRTDGRAAAGPRRRRRATPSEVEERDGAGAGVRAGGRGRRGREPGRGGARALSPIHRADAGHRVVTADAVGQQALADLPREHRHVLGLVARDRVDHLARRHLGLAAADHARLDRARVVVPAAVVAMAPTPDLFLFI